MEKKTQKEIKQTNTCTNFKQKRKELGLTQIEMAQRLDITTNYVSRIENGHKTPSSKIKNRLKSLTLKPHEQFLEASGFGVSMLSYSQLHENFNKMQEIAMGQMEALSRLRANYEKVMELLRQQTQANAELLTLLSEVDSGSAQ